MMNKKVCMLLLIIVIIIILNFVFPNYSYAIDGGTLLSPIMKLLTSLCDGIIDILQKFLFGIEGDALWAVDRVGNFLSKIVGLIGAILLVAGSVALAIFFAAPTGGASIGAMIAVGVKTAILSIGKAVITFFAVSAITEAMLPDTFYLPFISISPEHILQNKIEIFDVNFFDVSDVSNDNPESESIILKKTIAKWYYALRNVSMVCLMIVLLYLGIRILISSVASEKAKYKKMLVDWTSSMCLLFVIHYIMIFSVKIVNTCTDLIGESIQENSVKYYEIVDDKVYDYVEANLELVEDREQMIEVDTSTPIEGGEEYTTLYINDEGNKTVRFPIDNFLAQARMEMQLLDKYGDEKYSAIGWHIIYIMLTLYTVLFCYIYLKRVAYIGFLILVSPLVILTYSIDKLHDSKAQGFNTWFKEFLFNLAIQPFHLLLYIVFVNSAMAFASKNPIYVLIILGFIAQAEKILRKMFGFEKASTPGVLSGALGAGLAMTGIQKLFGRKGNTEVQSNKKTENNQEENNESINIKEQNIDDILANNANQDRLDNKVIERKENTHNQNADKINLDIRDNQNRYQRNINTKDNQNKVQKARKIKKPKKNGDKPTFNYGQAIKGATRYYIQQQGEKLVNRVNNTSLLSEAVKATAGGFAALTAGTAGVMLGTLEGSPEKALRNAGMLGAVAYKGTSQRVESSKVKGINDSFIKAGYGKEYKKVEEELLSRQIRHNLRNRTELEMEFGWSNKQINEFYQQTMQEYIDSGIKNFKEMIIGEKLKAKGLATDTKQAIGIISLGKIIGADTRRLTTKKRQEWVETIISKSEFAELQTQIKTIQKDYEEQIRKIKAENISKKEQERKIRLIEKRKEQDTLLQDLTQRVRVCGDDVLGKLDGYSELRYK